MTHIIKITDLSCHIYCNPSEPMRFKILKPYLVHYIEFLAQSICLTSTLTKFKSLINTRLSQTIECITRLKEQQIISHHM